VKFQNHEIGEVAVLLLDLAMKTNPELASSLFGKNDVRTVTILKDKIEENRRGIAGSWLRAFFRKFW
jgi:hypothetical protein